MGIERRKDIKMTERPILFSSDMVRAILEGRKIQSRRIIKPHPIMMDSGTWYPSNIPGDIKNKTGKHYANEEHMRRGMVIDFCPYKTGMNLWVRETWCNGQDGIVYKADHPEYKSAPSLDWKWKPSIFMPRWASRITLKIKNVRVERLQEISEEDAWAEGIGSGELGILDINGIVLFKSTWNNINAKPKPVYIEKKIHHYVSYPFDGENEAREFRGKTWYILPNPWVRVIEFERIQQ
jgi:hypothetical protein